ncbi:MAG: stage V sporulation protein AD [Clostridia bacterium]|nr:stage V sporulation protein AD [Clostridia bacterium]
MKKQGKQTYVLSSGVSIVAAHTLVGTKEKHGPLANYFKDYFTDDTFGQPTFEKAEREMLLTTITEMLKKNKINIDDIDIYIGGDILNQLVTTNYVAEQLQIPFIGAYSACSSVTESIALASALIDGNFCGKILCSACSHFSTAERQYRFPLEFGNQRQAYSQWTVTGAGCMLLSKEDSACPKVTKICFGKVVDYGVLDLANMGAAMAPAAADTLHTFFIDTNTTPTDYDLIATGDLGKLGSDIFRDLLAKDGINLGNNYIDCGHMIFNEDEQCMQGGSGAGCSASVFSGYIYTKLKEKKFKKVLLLATGALMSTTTNQQGDSIPAISHLIMVEA